MLRVSARTTSSNDPDAFDVRRIAQSVTILKGDDGIEHVLVSEGTHRIQIEVRRDSLLSGPVRLRYDLAGTVGIELKLIALQRLLALQRLGRFPRSLYLADRRAQRWMLALRALDGVRVGASHRAIATALWGETAVSMEWRGSSDYLRARVRRLINIGEKLADGGYRYLLKA